MTELKEIKRELCEDHIIKRDENNIKKNKPEEKFIHNVFPQIIAGSNFK